MRTSTCSKHVLIDVTFRDDRTNQHLSIIMEPQVRIISQNYGQVYLLSTENLLYVPVIKFQQHSGVVLYPIFLFPNYSSIIMELE